MPVFHGTTAGVLSSILKCNFANLAITDGLKPNPQPPTPNPQPPTPNPQPPTPNPQPPTPKPQPTNSHTTSGFFGKGIYGTPDAEYAWRVCVRARICCDILSHIILPTV
jgi:hypothetical protein